MSRPWFPASQGHNRGVGEHPHRGFETVTIVYKVAPWFHRRRWRNRPRWRAMDDQHQVFYIKKSFWCIYQRRRCLDTVQLCRLIFHLRLNYGCCINAKRKRDPVLPADNAGQMRIIAVIITTHGAAKNFFTCWCGHSIKEAKSAHITNEKRALCWLSGFTWQCLSW